MIDDSPTGWYLDHYLGISSYSTRYLENSGITFHHWSVEEKAFLLHQMFPYDVVIDMQVKCCRTLHKRPSRIDRSISGWWRKIHDLSNSAHTVLDQSKWFSDYFGLQIENANVREKTVIGIPNTATGIMYFDTATTLWSKMVYTLRILHLKLLLHTQNQYSNMPVVKSLLCKFP